jgi:hypothetical protein
MSRGASALPPTATAWTSAATNFGKGAERHNTMKVVEVDVDVPPNDEVESVEATLRDLFVAFKEHQRDDILAAAIRIADLYRPGRGMYTPAWISIEEVCDTLVRPKRRR